MLISPNYSVPTVTVAKRKKQVIIRFSAALCRNVGLDKALYVSIFHDDELKEVRFWASEEFYEGPLADKKVPAHTVLKDKSGAGRFMYAHSDVMGFLPSGKYVPMEGFDTLVVISYHGNVRG